MCYNRLVGDYMKNKSNLIDTKEELIKNFSKEQMEIYNYYKSKFSYANEELYPVVKEDKELVFLENTYSVLKTIFKAEIVISLLVVTFVFIFTGTPKQQIQYKQKDQVHFSVVQDVEE